MQLFCTVLVIAYSSLYDIIYSNTADNIRDMIKTKSRNKDSEFMYILGFIISSMIQASGSFIEGGKSV